MGNQSIESIDFTKYNKENPGANACVNFSHDWGIYIRGYTQGAEELLKIVMEKRLGVDTLVYPICFMLRHALELSLKQLIETCNKLLETKTTPPGHHKLHDLADYAIKKVNEVREHHDQIEKLPPDMEKNIKLAARSVHGLDQFSDVFRYPVHGDGKSTLHKDLRYIDYQSIYETINTALRDISSVNSYLDNILDFILDYKFQNR